MDSACVCFSSYLYAQTECTSLWWWLPLSKELGKLHPLVHFKNVLQWVCFTLKFIKISRLKTSEKNSQDWNSKSNKWYLRYNLIILKNLKNTKFCTNIYWVPRRLSSLWGTRTSDWSAWRSCYMILIDKVNWFNETKLWTLRPVKKLSHLNENVTHKN